jgi:hypothetical protein
MRDLIFLLLGMALAFAVVILVNRQKRKRHERDRDMIRIGQLAAEREKHLAAQKEAQKKAADALVDIFKAHPEMLDDE